MLISASEEGYLAHPISPNLPCAVLQYADVTAILVKATPDAALHLRRILDSFAAATGLSINYNKTTFIPIHVDASSATTMAQSLGTSISTFPQTYLGLPLSTHKISSSDLKPLFSKAGSYLAGWKPTC